MFIFSCVGNIENVLHYSEIISKLLPPIVPLTLLWHSRNYSSSYPGLLWLTILHHPPLPHFPNSGYHCLVLYFEINFYGVWFLFRLGRYVCFIAMGWTSESSIYPVSDLMCMYSVL